jgi:chromosome segregation protein
MKIKRLEIQGFKSFADRINLKFGEGVTGVVGPNGCGKSNVVDALRWVMGEQSAKHLRGNKMADVIFNGSAARGPMGMAEVSVFFENDGANVPQEYAHYNEIQVTRRLYRDGDSDYEINRTACRLRDVHELFLGTGIGTKAYSIIEQGQVSTLVKARPEDRRRIIEEAAGITKYKARRLAAERKMEATRQNLLRVTDVIMEISRRLGSLKRQANKAERYKSLKAEAREIELHHAALRFLEISTGLEFDREALWNVEEELAGIDAKIAELEARAEAERLELLDEDERLQRAQARLYELDNEIALAEQNKEHATSALEDGVQRRAQTLEEIQGLEEALGMIRSQREALVEGERGLDDEARSHEDRLSEASAQLELFQTRRVARAAEAEGHRAQMLATVSQAAQAEAELARLVERANELDERIKWATEEADAETERLEKLSEERERLELERYQAAEERAAREIRKGEVSNELDAARRESTESEEKLHSAKEKVGQVKSRLESLREISASFDRSPEGVRALMLKAEREPGGATVGLFADLFVTPAELETAVESAGRELLQSVVVKTGEDALGAVRWLRETDQGRARVFAQDALHAPAAPVALEGAGRLVDHLEIPDYHRETVRSLLGDVYFTDEASPAIIARARACGLTLVTKSGEVFDKDGGLRGGSGAEGTGLLKHKREVRELDEELAVCQSALEAQQAAFDGARLRVQQLESELEQLGQETHRLQLVEMERKQEHARHEDEITRRAKRRDELNAESREKQLEAETVAGDRATREEILEKATARRTETETAVKSAEEELASLDADAGVAAEKVTSLKVEVAAHKERRENLKQSLEHHARNEDDVRARVERLRELVTELESKKGELEGTITESDGKIGTLLTERVDLKERLEGERKAYDEAMQAVRQLEGEARAARQASDGMRKGQNQREVRIRERELEMDALVDRTISAHRVRPEEILFDYHLLAPPTQRDLENLDELKRKIANMGEINLTAIDEYNELSERHGFLKSQSDDLTHALSQLEKAIIKINRTTKKRFLEAFEKINDHFQKVFPRLFRGGKAWLAMTDPNDLLATGVEIYAQPPGKKLQSVALMSGGEQALTAVSLIFGIFLLKPSPFCLLDEVDAPLDEANVGRFNDMIKDVSKISQFIVITHNKKTMEQADQLYGITMEEPGISKMVNVQMH